MIDIWQQKYIFSEYVSTLLADFLFFLYFCTRFFQDNKVLIQR